MNLGATFDGFRSKVPTARFRARLLGLVNGIPQTTVHLPQSPRRNEIGPDDFGLPRIDFGRPYITPDEHGPFGIKHLGGSSNINIPPSRRGRFTLGK